MLFWRLKNLVATLILSQLLWSTSSFSQEFGFSEWIFQIRSTSGYLLSPGLLSLKRNNSGADYYFPACEFFQITGAITTNTNNGCIVTTLDNRNIYVNNKGLFEKEHRLFITTSVDEVEYLSQEDLTTLGYRIEIESSEMLVSISHLEELPIDKKNQLLDQSVVGKSKETKMKSERQLFSVNRFLAEGYTSPSRKGNMIEADSDFFKGEFIYRQCDNICLSYINWNKRWKKKDHTLDLYVGNYDLYYFPGKWNRLKDAAVVEINKKSSRQKFSFEYGATTDYFIYRNGILVKKGRGSLKDIELDLSEENYFAQYTVKVIDTNGRIQTFDLYTGLGLLGSGDYSLAAGHNTGKYGFANGQLGITKNLNVMAGIQNDGVNPHYIKRAKTSFKYVRFEIGELTSQSNVRENSYQQGEINYSQLAYIYNRRTDDLEERNNKQHTFLYTPSGGLMQFQHRINDDQYFENEFLLGKQVHDLFLYGRYLKRSDNSEKQSFNVSGSLDYISYDVGVYSPWETPGVFGLVSGNRGRWRVTGNLDINPLIASASSRVDYNYKNKNIYTTYKHNRDASEFGVGMVFSFFPAQYDLNLKRPAQSLVLVRIFLDLNENNIMDAEDIPLTGIGGSMVSRTNYSVTDDSGKMYFEIDNSYRSALFFFDESTFKEMYYLPPENNLKLELAQRKVNNFDIPIKINGVILIECTTETPLKDVVIYRNDEQLQTMAQCQSPTVLDHMRPGNYRVEYSHAGKHESKSFVLNNDSRYFYDLEI